MLPWIILIVVLLVIVVAPISIYNGLVRRRNAIDNAQGAIDAVLKQRFDLLPNLVETVSQYAAHEATLLGTVTALRRNKNSYGELTADEKSAFDSGFTRSLQEQLSAARRTYNAVVTDYNNAIQVFPSSLVAGMFRFAPARVLETPAAEQTVPNVRNLFNNR